MPDRATISRASDIRHGARDDVQDYYYFLACVGRKCEPVATRPTGLVLRT